MELSTRVKTIGNLNQSVVIGNVKEIGFYWSKNWGFTIVELMIWIKVMKRESPVSGGKIRAQTMRIEIKKCEMTEMNLIARTIIRLTNREINRRSAKLNAINERIPRARRRRWFSKSAKKVSISALIPYQMYLINLIRSVCYMVHLIYYIGLNKRKLNRG